LLHFWQFSKTESKLKLVNSQIVVSMAYIRASQEGIKRFKRERNKNGWNQDADSLTTKIDISRSTVQRFEQRNQIRQDYFVALCKAVGIEKWAEIVDNTPIQPNASYMEFSVYDDAWVGRESLIQQLSDRVKSSCRVLLLVGITGIGKTALAERVVQELRGDWREYRDNFEDENKASDFASVALQWLEKWGEIVPKEERKPEQLLQRLVKRLRENRYLILIDSLEYLLTGNEDDGWGDFKDEWWGKFFVSFLAESECKSRFILTSQDLPTKFETEGERYKNLWYCQLLKGLEVPEQVALFQKVELDGDLELPYSPLRVIGEVYDGHPLALRTIAGEIKGSYSGKVRAYWKDNSRYIEEVKEAIDEARNEGIVKGDEDRWQLASYTKVLRNQVKKRIQKTFERLKNDVYDAYVLLCTASVYRCEVKENWWLINLEDEGYSEERQKAAIETLRERYLVEDGGIDDEDNRLVGQHNLIRSVAIAHRLKLPEN
jgi:hypothetical protein